MSLPEFDTDLEDLPPIKLNPDNAQVALKKIRDIQCALAAIGDGITSDEGLNASLARNVLFVSEHNMADLGKLLGVETDSARDIAQRNAMLREANTKVHELEKKMGASQSPEDVQAGIKHLAECASKWWRYEGFGHVSEFEFGQYGASMKLSCHLFGSFRLLDSPTPLSDKEAKAKWYEHLAEQGIVLTKNRGEMAVVDCDQTRATLRKLLAERIPSARIQNFENQGSDDLVLLRQVKIFVRDITELAGLPLDPNPNPNEY
jgi:hypothetical protein